MQNQHDQNILRKKNKSQKNPYGNAMHLYASKMCQGVCGGVSENASEVLATAHALIWGEDY